tara:strand:+ start:775 stop:2076 length:1302 start_codon:yes stop_codon:yes gene_type:complete
MKPLNRPMFKYGGPIKEGIMNGMKEKQAINTVGSPLAPKDETGRGGYAAPLLPLILSGLGTAGRLALRPLGKFAARTFSPGKGNIKKYGGYSEYGMPTYTTKVMDKAGPTLQKGTFQPNPFGAYLIRSPEGRFLTGAAGKAGAAGKKVFGVGKSLASSPLTVGSAGIYGGKAIYDRLTKEKTPEAQAEIEAAGGAPGGGDRKMFSTPKQTVVSEEKLEQMNKDRIQKNKERYYKLMGLDNMKKDAVYDSLIDASKIISEEGADLKGSIKSGTLQNRIIQAISGQLDKSANLKKQIDAAVLKGEIEKDIKANDPSAKLAAEYTKKRIDLVDKQLAGGDLDDIAGEYRKQGLSLKGQSLFAEASRKGIDTKGILPTENVDKFMNDNPTLTEADFVNVYQEQLVEAGKNKLPAGDYVVGGRIITVGDDGKAKAFVY